HRSPPSPLPRALPDHGPRAPAATPVAAAPAAAARKPRRSRRPSLISSLTSLPLSGEPDRRFDFYRKQDTKARPMKSKSAPLLTAPAELRFEHLDQALGIEQPAPRLSWIVPSAPPGWVQEAYEVELDGECFRIEGAGQVLVPWPGAPLAPRAA